MLRGHYPRAEPQLRSLNVAARDLVGRLLPCKLHVRASVPKELCELQNYLIGLVQTRIEAPGDDMLSDLIAARTSVPRVRATWKLGSCASRPCRHAPSAATM